MCLIWGVPYLLIKVAVGELTPASLVFVRTAIGAAVLLPLAAMRGQLRVLLPRWKPLLAYTVVELAVPWLLLTSAEQRLTSSLSGLLVAAVPLVGAVLAWMAGGHEPLGVRRLIGLLVGLAGVAALVGADLRGGNAVAFAEIAVVAIGYALGPFIFARNLSDLPGLGVVFLDEPFTVGIAAGFALILVGSVLATGRSRTAGTDAGAADVRGPVALAERADVRDRVALAEPATVPEP
jgi:drug/metabolite transporter (DMT)-like permease